MHLAGDQACMRLLNAANAGESSLRRLHRRPHAHFARDIPLLGYRRDLRRPGSRNALSAGGLRTAWQRKVTCAPPFRGKFLPIRQPPSGSASLQLIDGANVESAGKVLVSAPEVRASVREGCGLCAKCEMRPSCESKRTVHRNGADGAQMGAYCVFLAPTTTLL
jgi:hypothetical protein